MQIHEFGKLCTWRIDVHITSNNMIQWEKCRNCTKLVLKPLAAKTGFSISVLCIAKVYTISVYMMTTSPQSCTLHDLFTWQHYHLYLHGSTTIFIYMAALPSLINWNEGQFELPVFFLKNVFFGTCNKWNYVFVTFNIIISYIFPKNLIQILPIVQKIWRLSL